MHATETKARKERGGNAPVNMERDREITRTTRNTERIHMSMQDRERERERERKRENVIMCERKCVARRRGKQDRNTTTKDCQKDDQRMLMLNGKQIRKGNFANRFYVTGRIWFV